MFESQTYKTDIDSLFKTEEEWNAPYVSKHTFETVRIDETSPVFRTCSNLYELNHDIIEDDLSEDKQPCNGYIVRADNLLSFYNDVVCCIKLQSETYSTFCAYTIVIVFDGLLNQDHIDILSMIVDIDFNWNLICPNANHYIHSASVKASALRIDMWKRYAYLRE